MRHKVLVAYAGYGIKRWVKICADACKDLKPHLKDDDGKVVHAGVLPKEAVLAGWLQG